MANRWFNQFSKTLEKEVVSLFARVTFGAAGASTLDTTLSKGIVSITHDATGKYTFVFGTQAGMLDVYNKSLNMSVIFNSGAAAPAAPLMYIISSLVAVPASCSIQMGLTNTSGTLTDPATGEIGHFRFQFKNSTAP